MSRTSAVYDGLLRSVGLYVASLRGCAGCPFPSPHVVVRFALYTLIDSLWHMTTSSASLRLVHTSYVGIPSGRGPFSKVVLATSKGVLMRAPSPAQHP